MNARFLIQLPSFAVILLVAPAMVCAEEASAPPKAFIDGTGHGWRSLGEQDFTNVNCSADTWTWTADGVKCTGQPVGVIRSRKPYTNFELVTHWKHLKSGGNSGIFVWTSDEAIKGLKPGSLPKGGI